MKGLLSPFFREISHDASKGCSDAALEYRVAGALTCNVLVYRADQEQQRNQKYGNGYPALHLKSTFVTSYPHGKLSLAVPF